MDKQSINYETILRVTRAMSMSRDPEEVVLLTVKSVKEALGVQGCALFLNNHKTRELELAAANGLSSEYLNKGPVSALKSISQSLEEGPVAIYDVSDDPRIQYPAEAKKEGISSILSVPIQVHGRIIGAFRVYTADPWEFGLEDVTFVQAMAQIAGLSIEMARLNKGLKTSIEVLKGMRAPKEG